MVKLRCTLFSLILSFSVTCNGCTDILFLNRHASVKVLPPVVHHHSVRGQRSAAELVEQAVPLVLHSRSPQLDTLKASTITPHLL